MKKKPEPKKSVIYWLCAGAGVLLIMTAIVLIFWQGDGPEAPEEVSQEETTEVAENDEKANENTEQSQDNPDRSDPNTDEPADDLGAMTAAMQYAAENCTLKYNELMLINPVFQVKTDFIAARQQELVNLTTTYGIRESGGNGIPRMDAVAAVKLDEMIKAYREAYPGHNLTTRSCFRPRGTNCGRLCYATGTSDHHSGYTCDLIDTAYGTELNTDLLVSHLEWQWLKENSYKYGFIDRFPQEWAGGSMSEPVNINAEGSTGLYETWHYRYVGVPAAVEIATGKYNNGNYDSLEHYLLATGRVSSLTGGLCAN